MDTWGVLAASKDGKRGFCAENCETVVAAKDGKMRENYLRLGRSEKWVQQRINGATRTLKFECDSDEFVYFCVKITHHVRHQTAPPF